MTRPPLLAVATFVRRTARAAGSAFAVVLVAGACTWPVAALAVGAAPAQEGGRAACKLGPASGDVVSDAADATTADVSAAKPIGLANWNVRWWQRHRVWITVTATNRGDQETSVLPEIVVDLHRASAGSGLPGLPLALAPHATASTRLAFYVPDDTKTLGLRVHAATSASDVGVALSVACSDASFDVGEMARPAALVLDEALTLYLADFIDTLPYEAKLVQGVRLLASGAQDADDVAWAMRGLMSSVGDVDSTMAPPGAPMPAPAVAARRPPDVERRADGIAVLRLFPADFLSDGERVAWARDLQQRIAVAASAHPRAWVVDLREDAGSDLWPSLAALSSLLDGPAVGAFVTRAGSSAWIVERGAARVAGAPPELDLGLAPEPEFTGRVAVLLGMHTTNVGEAVAVAFEGRSDTRFFGAPTRGFPELGVHAHRLADGSTLGVLDTRVADRSGQVYRSPITPDEPLDASEHSPAVPNEAVDWLLDRGSKAVAGR